MPLYNVIGTVTDVLGYGKKERKKEDCISRGLFE